MSPEESQLFKSAGIHKKDFAAKMGLHTGTVYGWKKLPQYARQYLALMIRHKNLQANFKMLQERLEGLQLEAAEEE